MLLYTLDSFYRSLCCFILDTLTLEKLCLELLSLPCVFYLRVNSSWHFKVRIKSVSTHLFKKQLLFFSHTSFGNQRDSFDTICIALRSLFLSRSAVHNRPWFSEWNLFYSSWNGFTFPMLSSSLQTVNSVTDVTLLTRAVYILFPGFLGFSGRIASEGGWHNTQHDEANIR